MHCSVASQSNHSPPHVCKAADTSAGKKCAQHLTPLNSPCDTNIVDTFL